MGSHLPCFPAEKTASPEEAFALLPFASLAVSIGEESGAFVRAHAIRSRRGDDGLPLRGGPVDLLLQQSDRLGIRLLLSRRQGVRRSGLNGRHGRKHLQLDWVVKRTCRLPQ